MILSGLLILALIATTVSLAFGLLALFKGDDFNKKYGNAAMRWRILLQGLSLLILFFMFWMGKK